MLKSKEENWKRSLNNELFLMVLCFLGSALVGYILTNHIALFGF